MKLHLPTGLRAALIAALTAVGFTLTQAQAGDVETTLTTTFGNCAQTTATSVTLANVFANTDVATIPQATVASLTKHTNGDAVNIMATSDHAASADATFFSPNINVGNSDSWKLTLNYSSADDIQSITGMTLSVGLFNSSGDWQTSNASWTGNETFTATVTANGVSKSYTGNLFAGDPPHNGQGSTKFAVTLAGEALDLTSATDFSVVIDLPDRTLGSGCFVGLQNIGFNVMATLPEITEYVWHGTEGSKWSDSVWNNSEAFVANNNAKFDSTAAWTTVTIDSEVEAKNVTVEGAAYTFNIQAGASLKTQGFTLSGTGASATLDGSGKYELNSGVDTMGGMAFAGTWTGTVKLSNITTQQLDLNNYGTAKSVVEIDGWSKYLKDANDYVYNPKLRLSGAGMTIQDGYSNRSYIFAGGVEGEGDFKLGITTRADNQTYIFTGDVSSWTGSYESQKNKTTTLKFYDKATEMGAAIKQTSGVINIEVGDGTNVFTTAFDQAVTATALTIKDKATATLKGASNIVNVTGAGSLIVNAGANTVTFTGDANVISNTIDLTSGTLDISGAVLDVSGISGRGMETSYSDGQNEGNGFATVSGTVDVVNINGGTLTRGAVQVKYNGASYTMDENGDIAMSGSKSLTTFYVNESGTTESLQNAWNKSEKDGNHELTTVIMKDGTKLQGDAEISLTALTVAENASATVEVIKALSISTVNITTAGKTLTFTGNSTLDIGSAAAAASLNGAGDLVINGPTVTVTGTNNASFTGNVDVQSGTLKLGDSTGDKFVLGAYNYDTTRTITIHEGATLDLNGKADGNYVYTLAGGTLTNTGAGLGNGSSQSVGIILTADSYVGSDGSNEFWLRQRSKVSGSPTSIKLNEYDLTKRGDNIFGLFNTTITGTGALVLEGGTVQFNGGSSTADVTFNGGNITGTMNLSGDVTLTAQKAGSTAAIDAKNHAITFDGAGELTIGGTISNATSLTKNGTGTVVVNSAIGNAPTIAVKAGTLKATVENALGTGAITVDNGAVLELTNGGALRADQVVASSGDVTIHNTLTRGKIDGGTLTLAADFPVTGGGLEDVGGSTSTGNGFSQGGTMHIVENRDQLVKITGILHGSKEYELTEVDQNGNITSGANWSIYQLNTDSQYAVKAIMDYANTQGSGADVLKTIVVNGMGEDGYGLSLVDDSSKLRTSMLEGEHLESFTLNLAGETVLNVDSDCVAAIGTAAGSNATISLEKDATVGSITAADQENWAAVGLTISGKEKTITTGNVNVEFGSVLTIDEDTTVKIQPENEFVDLGSFGEATVKLKKGAVLEVLGKVKFSTLADDTEATIAMDSDEPMWMYSPTYSNYSIKGARIVLQSAAGYELNNIIDATSEVVNAGPGTMTDISTNAAYAELAAQGGDIALQGKTADMQIGSLKVAAGHTVSMTDSAAAIVVSKLASFGSGATVSSALTMANGATLDGTASLDNHDLSLASGLLISDALWDSLQTLTPGDDTSKFNLFTGVSALTLAGAEYDKTKEYDLTSIFSHETDIKSGKYSLSYDGSNVIVSRNADNGRYWKGGSETWDYSTKHWTDEDGGGNNVAFAEGYNAYFTSTDGGTVTLDRNITAASITVSGADYTFEPNGFTLTVTDSVEVSGDHTATFNMGLVGDKLKLTVKNDGVLELNAGGDVNAVELEGGTVSVGSGTLTTDSMTVNGSSIVDGSAISTDALSGTGTLVLGGCTLTFTSSTDLTDAVSIQIAHASTLATSGEGVTLKLKEAIENPTEDTVTFTGTYDLSNLTATEGETKYVEGEITGNGFKQAQKTIEVVNGGSANGTAATLLYNGQDIGKMNTDGVVTFAQPTDYSTFYVNESGTTEKVSKALSKFSPTPGTFVLADATTLEVDENIAMSMVNVATDKSATMLIDADKTVTTDGTAKTGLTLKGTGELAVASGKTTTGVTLDEADWKGTVSFKDASLTTGLSEDWGTANSTVALQNASGKLGNTIVDYALELRKTDANNKWGFGTSTGGTNFIAAALKGDGDLGVRGGSDATTFILDGSTDGWNGNFVDNSSGEVINSLTLYGAAKTIRGTVGGVLDAEGKPAYAANLYVETSVNTTFKESVMAGGLMMNSGTTNLEANSTIGALYATAGNLSLADNKTLTIRENMAPGTNFSMGKGAKVVLEKDAEMGDASNQGLIYVGGTEGATITNGAGTQQTYSLDNANITVDGAKLRFASYNNVVVNNVLENVSADTLDLNHSLELNNVTAPLTVGTSLSIAGGKTFKVANGDAKQTVVMGADSTLTTAADSVADANLIVNSGVILNMAGTLNLNGGALTLKQSSTLTGDLYTQIEAMEDTGSFVNLFTGVGALTLGDSAYSEPVTAALYFSNLGDLSDKGDYLLEYNDVTGSVFIRFEATTAHTLTWNGTEGKHSWVQDDETVTNWLEGDPAEDTYFQAGDNAKFTADAAKKVVTIADDIEARNITINSPELYTFETAADHSITAQKFEMTGHDGLAKTGKGKLTLDVIGDVSLTDSLLSVQEGCVEIGTDAKSGKLSLQASALEIVEGAAFSVATIEGDVTSSIELAGTMTVSEGTVSNLDATEGSTLKIADLGQTTAGTLSVKTDTTLYGFENGGTLDLGNKTLTLMEQTEQGGNVTANKLNLAQNGNVFNALETNRVTYACDSTGSGILDAETPNLVVDSIAPSMVIPSIALDVTETMGDGGSLAAINRLGDEVTYTLIHANDQTLVAGDFTLVGEALLIQNGLLHAESGLWSDGDNLNLTVGGLDLTWYTSNDETEWGYQVVSGGVLTDGANTLNGVQHVVVDSSRTVDVTGVGSEPGLRVRNLAGLDGRTITFSGEEGDTVNLITTEETASNVNLVAQNITVKVGLDELDAMDPVDYKDLRVGNVDLKGSTLAVHAYEDLDAAFTVNSLSGDGNSMLKGRVIVEGKGGAYRGGYENAYVILHENAEQLLYAGKGLTVAGLGAAKLAYVGPEVHMDAIEGINMTVTLNDPKQDNSGATLVLDKPSWLVDGTIISGMSAINSAATLDTAEAPNLIQAAGLNLDGTTIILNQDAADDSAMAMTVNALGKTKGLYLAHLGAEDSNTDRVLLNGYLYNKYYQNARLERGMLLVDRRDAFFTEDVVRPTTVNGRAGAGMLDDALLEINPQATNPQGDLAAVMTALETNAVANPDRVAAAVAGASAAALGHAFNNDVQRQLRAIRNRTTTMGLAECTTHEGLPYVNAWVNAEGDYRKLDADGTLAGYTLSSWGGTIGCDVDLTGRLTVGAAFTVLHGEFTSHSADMCEGDLDRDYVSLFARYGYRAWTHTFVATLGFAKSKVDRTVNYGTGSYTTRGDSDGNAFGFLYEVGYTKALNEDASTCLQPIFNVNYRHSSLGGYTEKGGSDAALSVGSADMDAVTFGLGARLQSIVGTSVYNRATLFEGRVLAKLDAGDRDCTTNSSLIGVSAKRSVKSAEVGAFGVEVGAGLTIPVGETGGSIFMDVTGDFRSGYTEFNGTVGYRFSF